MNDLSDELASLTKAVEEANRKQTLLHSFSRGLMVGIGSTVGAVVAITLLIYLLRNLIFVPYLGPLNRLLPKLEQALEQATGNGNLPAVVPAPTTESTASEGRESNGSL